MTFFDKTIVFIAILWYSFTAFYSVGYFHADEHYQIIEFSSYKQGLVSTSDLPWEFNAKIRSTIQPTLCVSIFKLCSFLNIEDAYSKSFILRLLTAFLSVFSIYYFARSCKQYILKENWKWFLIISYFTWFLPFINVRFSSETWSGMFLLLAIATVLKDKKTWKHFLVIGVCLGISFLFRFQTVLASLGIFLWLLFIQKDKRQNLLVLALSGIFIFVLGIIIDCWFYNEYICTAWRYFKINVFEHSGKDFGNSPWFYYFYYILRYSFYPIGLIIILSTLYLCFTFPKNLLIWIIVPFFCFHSVIAHKELRFLFPLLNIVPVIFFISYQKLGFETKKSLYNKIITSIICLLLFINIVGLITASFKPADIGRIRIMKELQNSSKPVNLICTYGCNPYDPWNGIVAHFYLVRNISTKNLQVDTKPRDSDFVSNKQNMIIFEAKDEEDTNIKKCIVKHQLKRVTQSIPAFFEPALKLYGYPLNEMLILYSE